MSWLSQAWKSLKGDRTDAAFAFGALIRMANPKQRTELRRVLYSVLYACDAAAGVVVDGRLDIARSWARKGLDILEES